MTSVFLAMETLDLDMGAESQEIFEKLQRFVIIMYHAI